MQYDPTLILTDSNRPEVIAFLCSAGHPEPSLAVASNVQLANLYHMSAPRHSVSEIQLASARAVIAALDGMRAAVPLPVPPAPPVPRLQHYRTPAVLRAVRRGHAVMMVGPAGCGKTTIGEVVAESLSLQFYITSTINDTHELIGFIDGYGKYHTTPFRAAFENGGLWIADEIDAWDASALLAANSALANGYCQFPDVVTPVRRHVDFRMVATANTFGTGADRIYVGRNELDAASLDRFAVIEVDYDLDLERIFANGSDVWLEHVWRVRKRVADKKIRHVVSSRAIAMGAAALADGETWDDVNDWYLMKGVSAADRRKVDD